MGYSCVGVGPVTGRCVLEQLVGEIAEKGDGPSLGAFAFVLGDGDAAVIAFVWFKMMWGDLLEFPYSDPAAVEAEPELGTLRRGNVQHLIEGVGWDISFPGKRLLTWSAGLLIEFDAVDDVVFLVFEVLVGGAGELAFVAFEEELDELPHSRSMGVRREVGVDSTTDSFLILTGDVEVWCVLDVVPVCLDGAF